MYYYRRKPYQLVLVLDEHRLYWQSGEECSLLETNQHLCVGSGTCVEAGILIGSSEHREYCRMNLLERGEL